MPSWPRVISAVSRSISFGVPAALVIDQDQVRDLDLAEVHSERVDPEPVMMLGIARGDVAGDTLGEPESPEDTKRGGKFLLPVQPFLLDGAIRGEPGHGRSALFGHSHFVSPVCFPYRVSLFHACRFDRSAAVILATLTRRRSRGRRLLGSMA